MGNEEDSFRRGRGNRKLGNAGGQGEADTTDQIGCRHGGKNRLNDAAVQGYGV